MSRLILMRHGKAEIAGATGGDPERPLAARGRAQAAETASWLSQAGLRPSLVLVSTALRTRETWDCAGAIFPGTRVEMRGGLYMASAEAMLDEVVVAPSDVETLMIVGHNPGLQELGLRLAAEGDAPPAQLGRVSEGFPPAAAWVFRMRAGRAVALVAAYEPPHTAGAAPRWAFVCCPAGAPT